MQPLSYMLRTLVSAPVELGRVVEQFKLRSRRPSASGTQVQLAELSYSVLKVAS